MSILITGGAGFIGSHAAKLLSELGENVVVLDNLSTGRAQNLRWGRFVEGDIADVVLVRETIRRHAVTAVLHLAASAQVAESMAHPETYFSNNISGSLRLLDAVVAEGVKQFVFASSSSVYGNCASLSAHEEEAVTPVSPYGESKLQIERVLPWYGRAHGLSWVALRLFNVAGAADGLGEDVTVSARIIPRAVHSLTGPGPALEVFGTSFPTVDGSAVRDYVHVSDVARAFVDALHFVRQAPAEAVINIGSGAGASVFQIIETVSRLAGQPVAYHRYSARPGDPACAVSDISKARRLLGWNPVGSNLNNIVASVLRSSRNSAKPSEDPRSGDQFS